MMVMKWISSSSALVALGLVAAVSSTWYDWHGDVVKRLARDEAVAVRGGQCTDKGINDPCPLIVGSFCSQTPCIDAGGTGDIGGYFCSNSTVPIQSNPNGIPTCVDVAPPNGKDDSAETQTICEKDDLCIIAYSCVPDINGPPTCISQGLVWNNQQSGCAPAGNPCKITWVERFEADRLLAMSDPVADPFAID